MANLYCNTFNFVIIWSLVNPSGNILIPFPKALLQIRDYQIVSVDQLSQTVFPFPTIARHILNRVHLWDNVVSRIISLATSLIVFGSLSAFCFIVSELCLKYLRIMVRIYCWIYWHSNNMRLLWIVLNSMHDCT